jgi:hypothetical protein
MEISASSGSLRVIARPGGHVFKVVLELAIAAGFVFLLCRDWQRLTPSFRIYLIGLAVVVACGLAYETAVTEIIEFGPQFLTITKDFHGWDKTQQYPIGACSDLEWERASEDRPEGFKCRANSQTVRFGRNLTEDQSVEILVALQDHAPSVPQKLCAYPRVKDHFLTLGLTPKR